PSSSSGQLPTSKSTTLRCCGFGNSLESSRPIESRVLRQCRLCLHDSVLRQSHLLPSWAYRRLKQCCDSGDHPVRVADGTACMTSAQTTQDLLCQECEDRFGQREDRVARLTELDDHGRPRFLEHITRVTSRTGKLVKVDDAIVEPLA